MENKQNKKSDQLAGIEFAKLETIKTGKVNKNRGFWEAITSKAIEDSKTSK